MTRMQVFGILWALVLLLWSCGEEAPPLPPSTATLDLTESRPALDASPTPELGGTNMPGQAARLAAASLVRTEVIRFEPPHRTATAVDGSCQVQSTAVRRPGTWRCISTNHEIYDPCFETGESDRMVCLRNPLQPEQGVSLRLLDAASTLIAVEPDDKHAWWVLTSDGRLCGFKAGGTAPVVNGLRMNYFCSDETALIGYPTPGDIWTARQVPAVQTHDFKAAETLIQLKAVWR